MCPTSEIESEDEGDLRQKRRSRPNQQYVHSDSDDQSSGNAKRKRFAKPPDVGFLGQTPKSSQSRKEPKSGKRPVVRPLGLEPTMNDSFDGMIYNYLEDLQTSDSNNTEMPGFATAHCSQYQQLQSPQHVQHLQDPQRQSTDSGMSGYSSGQNNSPPGLQQRAQNGMSVYSSGQYNTPPGVPQHRQNDFRGSNIHQYDPMHSVPNHGCNGGITQMTSDDEQLLKDLAIHKMTSVLTEVLVVVKDLSRDVQFIKKELAEGNMTPGGTRGPATATHMFPVQLPITSEQDFNGVESLLMEESVRQKMIARLALVGGTNSDHLIRRMLATVLTNTLASRFNWAGKKDKRFSESKKPFKDTTLQHCIFGEVPPLKIT
ncbi:uncharacterized protein LOC106534965 [Austrofundulus limnaeus]|uniref:Uncharacterized protein LOC106534965 n=1 Tax=Austrofundulus limnaeus TaxID=52670 RepID=A0A2I4D4S8_AUSLI|nr:PREDICTED: uncharacterized protein LOC106534965 [Austrofundulus limnaeus]